MNAQEQKQFKVNIIWLVLRPALKALLAVLKDEAIEFVKDKIEELKGEQETESAPPTCPPGQVWNPILGKCVDDIG